MALDSRFLAELKNRNNIVDVIAPAVQLKRNGTRHTGLCPFHGEKTPSFTVFEETASFYCFGCGAGGDVITFVMKYHNLDYMEAVRLLAERAGMELPEREAKADLAGRKRRERLYEMHRLAARFFFDTLTGPAGAEGLRYLTGRGIGREAIIRYGLGYAPDSYYALKDFLREKGFYPEEMLAAGLLAKSERSVRPYDKFRGRVMFPVFDLRGNVVAFSGRIIGEGQPKYLNSPETEIYTKGNCVFGLHLAKNEPEGLLILCEGNLDVVSLSQAGFTGAVAPLGTAFTKEQARILARYAKTVVVAFDNDSAGLKATEKAIRYLEENGIPVRVLQMQGAKDPDEFIKTYGRERFERLLKNSKTPVEFELDKLKAGLDLNDTGMKVEYLRQAVEVIAGLESAVERDVYIGKLSRELNVGAEAVRAETARIRKRKSAAVQQKAVRAGEQELKGVYDRVNPERAGALRAAKSEEMLIALLVRHPDLWEKLRAALPPEEWITSFNRRVYEFLLKEFAGAPDTAAPVFAGAFDEKEQARISFMINAPVLHGDPWGQMADCIQIIKSEGAKKIDPGALSAEEIMRRLQTKGD
ncbi:MAG: DNA primase [Clostridiales bacterium]|nr:MAG: DNA primase [Clostridiales bacterium]